MLPNRELIHQEYTASLVLNEKTGIGPPATVFNSALDLFILPMDFPVPMTFLRSAM